MGKITHAKIAKLAGVSQGSVSKALSGSDEICEETRNKIIKIATDNGYFDQKKPFRKVSTVGRTMFIAVLVPEIISINYATEATTIINLLEAMNAEGFIYVVGFEEEKWHSIISDAGKLGFDGIIALIPSSMQFLSRLNTELPIVFVSQFNIELPNNLVSSNIKGGISAAVRHLTGLGHTSIGFIGEQNTILKENIFKETMLSFGLSTEFIYTNDYRFEMCGYSGILKMLDSDHLYPTALICAYDEIAYGAINELKLYGYSVPNDFSVIGMNDVVFSRVMKPELTTIALHSDAMCKEAVNLLSDSIHGEQTITKHIEVQCDLTVRESTSVPRNNIII